MNRLNNFFNTFYYILFLSLITICSWAFNIELFGLITMCIIAVCTLLLNKDTSPLLPLMLFSSIIFSQLFVEIDVSFFAILFAPVVILSFILYFAINRVKLKTGKFFYGLLIAAIGLSLGGLLFDGNIMNFLTVSALSFFIVFLYVFFYSTSNAANFKAVMLKTAVGVIFVILAQIAIYYLKAEDYLTHIMHKTINLGWGNSNNAAFMLCILLPVTFLLSVKHKLGFLFLFVAYLQIIGIIFTLSRGNFLIGGFVFVVLLAVSFFKTKHKILYAIGIFIITAVSVILVLGNIESINIIKDSFLENGFDDNGRFELFKKAIEDFNLNPIFGVGFFKDFNIEENIPLLYHNTPLQILASLGVFGSLCFILFFVQRYLIPFKMFNLSNFYIFSIILISAIYGFIDGNFTFIYNAFLVIIAYIIIERETGTKSIFAYVKQNQKMPVTVQL